MKRQRNISLARSTPQQTATADVSRSLLSEKEACVLRHDKIRLLMILCALLVMFLCAVLFFTQQMLLPMLVVTVLAVAGYSYMNTKLRAVERTYAS